MMEIFRLPCRDNRRRRTAPSERSHPVSQLNLRDHRTSLTTVLTKTMKIAALFAAAATAIVSVSAADQPALRTGEEVPVAVKAPEGKQKENWGGGWGGPWGGYGWGGLGWGGRWGGWGGYGGWGW